MKKYLYHFGYSLIELLVVISVSALFFSFSFASYQNFNKSQVLRTSADEIKSVLRDTQNRAITGQKETGACAEYTDPKLLKGWEFKWGNSTKNYQIKGYCDSVGVGTTFGVVNYTLPLSQNVNFLNDGTIFFKPLNHGINVSGPICISNLTDYYKICVGSGGTINVSKSTSGACTTPCT